VLMNGDVHKSAMTTTPSTAQSDTATSAPMHNSTPVPNHAKLATLSPTQQQRYRQDWLERENQASSLAAAGMVAESVSLGGNNGFIPESTSATTANYVTTTIPVLGLQAPPTIVSQPLPGSNLSNSMVTELDSINWNLMDIGGMNIDDMDMDFATLFDPANELSCMPSPRDSTGTIAPMGGWPPTTMADANSVSPTPLSNQVWSENVLSGNQQQRNSEDLIP
jgi:hypothetical protein